jgi:hypothetical protein
MILSISCEAFTLPRDWMAVTFSSSWETAWSHRSGLAEGWVSRIVSTRLGGRVISDRRALRGGMIVCQSATDRHTESRGEVTFLPFS